MTAAQDRDILLNAILSGESPNRYPESLARFRASVGPLAREAAATQKSSEREDQRAEAKGTSKESKPKKGGK